MTNEELNKAVAEAQVWRLIDDGLGTLWQKSDSDVDIIPCSRYDPINNWQQAGELIEKYKFDLRYIGDSPTRVWMASSGSNVTMFADTPQRAICLAVLAAEGVTTWLGGL